MGLSLTILLVEDEPLIGLTLVDMLEDMGHRAIEAYSADEAVSQFSANPGIDLVITDLGLPDRSGDVLAGELRTMSPRLPVIFASGSPPTAARGDAPTAHLAKPFRMEELRDAIRAVMAG